jgi:hypothetical protein
MTHARNAVLAAMLALIPLPTAVAQGRTETRFTGMSWTKPAGMVETDGWTTICPERCVVYEGTEEDWPLVIVHEPVTDGLAAFKAKLEAELRKEDPEGSIITEDTRGGVDGDFTLTMTLLERKDDPDDGRPDYSLLLFLETGGVGAPIELFSLNREDLATRTDVLGEIADTLNINAAQIRQARTARNTELATLQKAMEAAYTRGETARLFMNVYAGVRNELAIGGGLNLVSFREENIRAFLPGGVFLDAAPDEGYRKPDLKRLSDEGRLGRWAAIPGGFAVTHADGRKETFRTGPPNDGAATLSDSDETFTEIPRYTSKALAGTYETISTFSAGTASYSVATVFTRSDSALLLSPSGTFEMSRSSFVAASGDSFALSRGPNETNIKGRWSYDPASYTLTLTPTDGSPVLTGPFHGGPFGRPDGIKPGESTDWRVFANEKWWKSS